MTNYITVQGGYLKVKPGIVIKLCWRQNRNKDDRSRNRKSSAGVGIIECEITEVESVWLFNHDLYVNIGKMLVGQK